MLSSSRSGSEILSSIPGGTCVTDSPGRLNALIAVEGTGGLNIALVSGTEEELDVTGNGTACSVVCESEDA